MICSRNVHKIIKRVKLDMMSDDAAQLILMFHIFIPHYSFHLSLLCTHLSFSSPFPVTNITSFRTIERVWKDVPTRVISNSLLGQAVINILRVGVYH